MSAAVAANVAVQDDVAVRDGGSGETTDAARDRVDGELRFGAFGAQGNDQSLWVFRQIKDAQEDSLVVFLAYRDFTAVRDRFFPRPAGPMAGTVKLLASRGRQLHLFFEDGSHQSLVPPTGSLRGMVPPRLVRDAKLPGGVMPRALFGDGDRLYAIVTTREAATFFDAGDTPSPDASEDQIQPTSSPSSPDGDAVLRRMPGDPAAAGEKVELPTNAKASAVSPVRLPTLPDVPLVVLRLDNDGWKFDRTAPGALQLTDRVTTAWVNQGAIGLIFVSQEEAGSTPLGFASLNRESPWFVEPLAGVMTRLRDGVALRDARFTFTFASSGVREADATSDEDANPDPPTPARRLPEDWSDVQVLALMQSSDATLPTLFEFERGEASFSTRKLSTVLPDPPLNPGRSRFELSMTAEEQRAFLACGGAAVWVLTDEHVMMVQECADSPFGWARWRHAPVEADAGSDSEALSSSSPDSVVLVNAPQPVSPLIPRAMSGMSRTMRNVIDYTILGMSLLVVLVWRRERLATVPDLASDQVLARLSQRILAAFVDLLILAPVGVAAFLRFARVDSLLALESFSLGDETVPEAYWLRAYLGMAFGMYGFLFEASIGATPGKRLLGMSVVREGGTTASVPAILFRNLARVIEFHFFPLMLLVMVTRGRQRLGDLVVGTLVIDGDASDRSPEDDAGPPPTDHFSDTA
ncbi:MAG: RDD family protein [Phycisphaerae bacterium]